MDSTNELQRRRKVTIDEDMVVDSSLPNGGFKSEEITPRTFPYAWTFGVLSSCLFLTVVLMPLLALTIPRAPRDDLPWWQKASILQLKTREFYDTDGNGVGDIRGITENAEHLQWLGVAAVLLDSIIPKTDDGVTNFYEVDQKLGTFDDFDLMIRTLHKKGIQVVLDLEINHSHQSHPWFQSSLARDPKYEDYYVWSDGKIGDDGKPQPPNNWLSLSGGSAWSFDSTRQQYYLHQMHHSLPDLNYHNPSVVDEVKNIMRFWLARGVDGFFISHADYLMETPDVTLNEPRSCNHDALLNEHRFLLHPYTRQVHSVHNLTQQLRAVLDEHQTPTKHLLLLLDSWPSDEGEDFNTWNEHNQGKTQLATNYALSRTLSNQTPCGGNCLDRHVSQVRDLGAVDALTIWTALLDRSTAQKTGNYASVYNILSLMLPGTPVLQFGQELAGGSQDCLSSIKEVKSCLHSQLVKGLHEVRQEPAFLWGRLENAVLNNNVFSFFRHAKGWSYTKYLVTVNVGNEMSNDSYIHSSPVVKCPEQGTVVAMTKPHSDRTNNVHRGDRVVLSNLKVYPGEGFVISLK